jgi:hypothetical protein
VRAAQHANEAHTLREAEDKIIHELSREYGVLVPSSVSSTTKRIIRSFSYPINSIEWLADEDEQSGKLELSKFLNDDIVPQDVHAVCIIDANDKNTDVIGLVFESKRAKDFRRNGPHIVSGELSFELGNAF